MTTAATPATVPTEADYQAAYSALAAGYDAVEQLVWRLNKVKDDQVADRTVSYEDVGVLATWSHDMRNQAEALLREIDKLEEHVYSLGDIFRFGKDSL